MTAVDNALDWLEDNADKVQLVSSAASVAASVSLVARAANKNTWRRAIPQAVLAIQLARFGQIVARIPQEK